MNSSYVQKGGFKMKDIKKYIIVIYFHFKEKNFIIWNKIDYIFLTNIIYVINILVFYYDIILIYEYILSTNIWLNALCWSQKYFVQLTLHSSFWCNITYLFFNFNFISYSK